MIQLDSLTYAYPRPFSRFPKAGRGSGRLGPRAAARPPAYLLAGLRPILGRCARRQPPLRPPATG
jgi:hypothetical protein